MFFFYRFIVQSYDLSKTHGFIFFRKPVPFPKLETNVDSSFIFVAEMFSAFSTKKGFRPIPTPSCTWCKLYRPGTIMKVFGNYPPGQWLQYGYHFRRTAEDMVCKYWFAFTGWCDDKEITGFYSLSVLVPNIFFNWNIINPVIKVNTLFIILVICNIREKTKALLQVYRQNNIRFVNVGGIGKEGIKKRFFLFAPIGE